MPRSIRSYLIFEQALGAGMLNLVLNAAAGWLLLGNRDSFPLYGDGSVANDTVGAAFLIPLLTTLIVTKLAKKEVAAGRLEQPTFSREGHPLWRRLPRRASARGLVFAFAALLIYPTAATGPLYLLGVRELSLPAFLAFKGIAAGVLAAAMTPAIAWCALGDLPRPESPPAG